MKGLNRRGNQELPGGGGTGGDSVKHIYGRVVDTILTSAHPRYVEKGEVAGLYGIFYTEYGKGVEGSTDLDNLQFAYCKNPYLITPPLEGELVKIENTINIGPVLNTPKSTKSYETLNLWNNPASNTYRNVYKEIEESEDVRGFLERETVPTKAAQGDVLFQGRKGQSIKFTASKLEDTPWRQDKTSPMVIIKNTASEVEDTFTPVYEDINKDTSSIYLTENHLVNLKPASERRETYNSSPTPIKEYNKPQAIITSGRVVLNAKNDSVLISGGTSIGLSAHESVNIDSDAYIGLDSEKIYLGKKARTSPSQRKEGVLLGNQTEDFLEQLLRMVEGLAIDMQTATTVDGKPIPLLNKRASQMLATTKVLRNRINPRGGSSLKSKKVFVE